MKISVAILTCDRMPLTKKTVRSFLEHNSRDNFDLFYGDDASKKPPTEFMERNDIPCIMRHKERQGCSPSSDELVHKVAAETGHSLILYLQNDFETVRPISMDVVSHVFDTRGDVGWMRLYGLNKNATIPGGNPTDPTNKFKPGGPLVEWSKHAVEGELLEVGDAQWSYHPAIHRVRPLLKMIKGAKRERDVGLAAVQTGLLTARFLRNITNHIGIRRTTPGGKFGKPWKTYDT